MATVWVLAANTNVLGAPLVKAAAITGFRHLGKRIDASGVHPGAPVTVAADFGHHGLPLPDGFHLDLLKRGTDRRRPARRPGRYRRGT